MSIPPVAESAWTEPFAPEDFGIGQLFWAIRDAVIVGDAATGRIMLWNPAAEAVFGYAAAEIVGQPLELLVPRELHARHRAGLESFAVAGQGPLIDAGHPIELPALRRDGTRVAIELSLTPIAEARPRGRFVLAILRDATSRKQAEAEHLALTREQAAREQAEAAVRDRDLFLASLAHDLRTPLTVAKMRVQQLMRRARRLPESEAEPVVMGLAKLEADVDRLTQLIAALLEAARPSETEAPRLIRTPVDLVALAQRVVADKEGGRVRVEAETLPPIVAGDALQLERVLANLVGNALAYSPESTSVHLRLTAADAGVTITVCDEGIGIPAADLPRLGEPFFRARNVRERHLPGTGIGLAGAKRIVAQHSGTLAITSTEGIGTTVTVWLPCTEPEGALP